MLANASDFIESREFFSWEQFFTALLTERTKGIKRLRYKKEKLNKAYLDDRERSAIMDMMPDLDL